MLYTLNLIQSHVKICSEINLPDLTEFIGGKMVQTLEKEKQLYSHTPFKSGRWEREIDVRDFIQKNYTPYEGDSSFLCLLRLTLHINYGMNAFI